MKVVGRARAPSLSAFLDASGAIRQPMDILVSLLMTMELPVFAQDPFTQGYVALLDQTYDVVDRIVLRAYFPMGQSPGGFRTWWRRLHNGSDDQLDNVHLQRLAGRFSRRVRG